MGCGGLALTLFTTTKLGWVISFRPRPLRPQGNHLRYPVAWRLGEPQNWSRRCRGERILVPVGNQTFAVDPVIRRSTDWATPAPNTIHTNINWLWIKRYLFAQVYGDVKALGTCALTYKFDSCFIFVIITISIEVGPWEMSNCSATQEISRNIW
jgi:hypothetical protein